MSNPKPKRPSPQKSKSKQIGSRPAYHPWDRRMKRLFLVAPQDIVSWVLPGATYLGMVSSELDVEEFFPDILCEVELNGMRMLLHIEFQKSADAKMLERVWRYNVLATIQYGCDVWSTVIFLKEDPAISAEGTLTRTLANGQPVHQFWSDVIRLWTCSLEELKATGLPGLSPLYVLCRDGTKREVVEEAVVDLMPEGVAPQRDLLTLVYGLASLAFEGKEEDQHWLVRRFSMLYDILKDTPAYRDLTKESRQEGREEGLEEGRLEGRLDGLRQVAVQIVRTRFSKLARLMKMQVSLIEDPTLLQQIIVKISTVQTAQEARDYLLALAEEGEDEDEE